MMLGFDPHTSARTYVKAGALVAAFLIFGVGGWAGTMELAGAIIAQGMLVVDSNVKRVQHPTGGVVGEILVRNGDHVSAGQVVLRLDPTQARANLAIIRKSIDELAAREARDKAERDDKEAVTFPAELLARSHEPEVAELMRQESRLFEIRRAARDGQKAQLHERIAQMNEQIKGLELQKEARAAQIQWIGKELEGVRELWSKKLVSLMRLAALEREAARLEGERGQLIAQIAEIKGRIAETELQIYQIDQDMRSEIGRDLAEIRAKQAELAERKIAAEDQLQRIDLRAPQDGFVHQLAVHTVGGVVTPADTLMLIVPEHDVLMLEAKIQPQDIDQVRVGTPATLRFTAFNQHTTAELTGTVSYVSADVSQDTRTGSYFYTARISVADEELARLGSFKLMSGMPVEVFIKTDERTLGSYLLRPLKDQIARAFKER